MSDFERFVGLAATACTLAVSYRPLKYIYNLYNTVPEHGNVLQVPVWPYIAFFTNSLVWANYGYLQRELIICWQNALSLVMAIASLAVLWRMMKRESPKIELTPSLGFPLHSLLFPLILCIFCVVQLLSLMTSSYMIAPSTFGLLGVVLAMAQFASPLMVLKQVLQQGFIGGLLDLPLAILMLLMGTLWSVYGNSLADPNIIVPNIIGALLAAVQVFLLCIVPPTRDGWPSCQSGACCNKNAPAPTSPKTEV